MEKKNQPIGVFDSGLGGLSVLRVLLKEMPKEDYLYLGDSKNAPYGIRPQEEIVKLTKDAVASLIEQGVKAVVIACNTATQAALAELQEAYKDMPIVGIEPAITWAASENVGKHVLVMATVATVNSPKIKARIEENKDRARFTTLGLKGLVERVEAGDLEYDSLKPFIDENIRPEIAADTGAITLGCTHFPFIHDQLSRYIAENLPGQEIRLYDGAFETVNRLKEALAREDLFNDFNEFGTVTITNSLNSDEMIERSFKLLDL